MAWLRAWAALPANADELGVVFMEEPADPDADPAAAFVAENGKRGIAQWGIAPLYRAGLAATLAGGDADLLAATSAVVCVNPDCLTAWARRRDWLAGAGAELLPRELAFVDLVLSKHPKKGEVWAHRRWVVSRPRSCFELAAELAACTRAATAYPKNYFAWSHRRWALLRSPPSEAALRGELQFTEDWLERHVSDHAAVHHRQQVLAQMGAGAGAGVAVAQRLIERAPGHEALWCHLRFCAQGLADPAPVVEWARAVAEDDEVYNFELQRKWALRFVQWLEAFGSCGRGVASCGGRPF